MCIPYACFQHEDAVGSVLRQTSGEDVTRCACSYDNVVIGISWKLSRRIEDVRNAEAGEGYSQERFEEDRRNHCGVANHLSVLVD